MCSKLTPCSGPCIVNFEHVIAGSDIDRSFYHLSCLAERWKNTFDKNWDGEAILMDLSEAFDTVKFDLLITKVGTCGFDTKVFKLIKFFNKMFAKNESKYKF